MKKCETYQLALSESLDSKVAVSREITQHLESCYDCREFAEFVDSDEKFVQLASAQLSNISIDSCVEGVMEQIDSEAQRGQISRLSQEKLRNRNYWKWASIAAAITLLFSLSLYLFVPSGKALSDPDVVIATPTAIEAPTEKTQEDKTIIALEPYREKLESLDINKGVIYVNEIGVGAIRAARSDISEVSKFVKSKSSLVKTWIYSKRNGKDEQTSVHRLKKQV